MWIFHSGLWNKLSLLDKICSSLASSVLFCQPQVSTASVNLATETAIVWPVSEAKVVPNWQKCIGETLAKHLTSCGFKSNLRGEHLSGVKLHTIVF